MKAFQGKKGQEKPYPRCLEGMIDMLDLSSGIVAPKRLTATGAHWNGSNRWNGSPRGDQSAGINDLTAAQPVEKQRTGVPGTRSRDRRTSVAKLLTGQELGLDREHQPEQPSVISRLMGGLSGSQFRQSGPAAGKTIRKEQSSNGSPEGGKASRSVENRGPKRHNQPCLHGSRVRDEPPLDCVQDQTSKLCAPQLRDELLYEKRMSLVRQKFAEARCLAGDEKTLRTKEFQDALQFLSTNRELFLRFLEEPDGLLTRNLHEQQQPAPSSASQLKHITILKPSKLVRTRSDSLIQKQLCSDWDEEMSAASCQHQRSLSISPPGSPSLGPTRIVVLKPGLGLQRTHHRASFAEVDPLYHSNEATGSGSAAEEAACDALKGVSSRLAYCPGEDQSAEISEGSNVGAESDFGTATSGHSWDCLSISGSPYSSSYYSLASPVHESSVIREAKKRISERWASVASCHHVQDQRAEASDAGTLGEVLTISKLNGEQLTEETAQRRSSSEEIAKQHSLHLTGSSKEAANSAKLGRASLLSRFLGLNREKNMPVTSHSHDNRSKEMGSAAPGSDEGSVLGNQPQKYIHQFNAEADGTIPSKEGLRIPRSFDDSQDEPSPVSVLDGSLLDEYTSDMPAPPGTSTNAPQQTLSRSPQIGSISRSMPWESFHSEAASPNSQRLSRLFTKADEDQNSFLFVRQLVAAAGLDGEARHVLHSRWHSVCLPLPAHLLSDICYQIGDGVSFRERQSKEKCLFDCCNEAFAEIIQKIMLAAYPWASAGSGRAETGCTCSDSPMAQELWNVIKNWSFFDRCYPVDFDHKGPAVELIWKTEAAGSSWQDELRREAFGIDAELCEMLLHDLIDGAAVELSDALAPLS